MHTPPSVDRHKAALAPLVAGLFALLGLTQGAVLGRIPQALHRTILRALQPAESAVRRLIAIVACTIDPATIKVKASRPRSPSARERQRADDLARRKLGLAIPFREEPARKEPTPRKPREPGFFFRLFDPRQRFFRKPSRKKSDNGTGPRVASFGNGGYRTISFALEPQPPKKDDGLETAAHLARRLQALKAALEDLPGQALRMAHAQKARAGNRPHTRAMPLARPRGFGEARCRQVL